MEQHIEAKPDGFEAQELMRLLYRGVKEIVFAVTHTLEGSTQTLENRRRLSALFDGNCDTWLGGREQEYEILRRPVRSLDLPSCLHSRDRRPQDRPEDHPQDRR